MTTRNLTKQFQSPRSSLDDAASSNVGSDASSDVKSEVSSLSQAPAYPLPLTPRAYSKAAGAIGDLQACFHNKASRKWAMEDLLSAYGFSCRTMHDSNAYETVDLQYSMNYIASLKVDRLFSRSYAAVAYLDWGSLKKFQEQPASRKWIASSPFASKKQRKGRSQASGQSSERDYSPFIPAVLIALAQAFQNTSKRKLANIQVHVLTTNEESPKTLRSYTASFSVESLYSFDELFQTNKNEPLDISCREIPLWPASKAVKVFSKVFDSYDLVSEGPYAKGGSK